MLFLPELGRGSSHGLFFALIPEKACVITDNFQLEKNRVVELFMLRCSILSHFSQYLAQFFLTLKSLKVALSLVQDC